MKALKKVKYYPTVEEINQALPKLKRRIDRIVILFSIQSGCRKQEILGLRSHESLQSTQIYVENNLQKSKSDYRKLIG